MAKRSAKVKRRGDLRKEGGSPLGKAAFSLPKRQGRYQASTNGGVVSRAVGDR